MKREIRTRKAAPSGAEKRRKPGEPLDSCRFLPKEEISQEVNLKLLMEQKVGKGRKSLSYGIKTGENSWNVRFRKLGALGLAAE